MTTTDQIKGIFSSIEGQTMADLQTTDQVADYLVRLTSWQATVNEAQAETGRHYNIAKARAYAYLRDNDITPKGAKSFSATVAKDYVQAQCSKEAYAYDMAERCSRLITHTIDAMRSVISAKKSEMEALRYAGT